MDTVHDSRQRCYGLTCRRVIDSIFMSYAFLLTSVQSGRAKPSGHCSGRFTDIGCILQVAGPGVEDLGRALSGGGVP